MNTLNKTLRGPLAAALFAVGACGHVAATTPSTPQATDGQAELVPIWQTIDELAAHPDDPALPAGVAGVTDASVAALADEEVELLLAEPIIDIAARSDSPRHLFALGRVASLHGHDDLAYQLLAAAVEAGSAPAHLYITDWYTDDRDQTLALLGAAIEMGFGPADAAWDQAEAHFASRYAAAQAAATSAAAQPLDIASIDFAQADIVAALFAGNGTLEGIEPKIPHAAPDWVKDTQGNPALARQVREAITTMYACHLGIALIDKAIQENPAYLPETPLVSNFVSADTKAVASLRLDTGEMLLNKLGGKLVGRWQSVKGALDTTWRSAKTLFGQADGLSLDGALGGLEDIAKAGTDEYLLHDKRRKALERMNETIKDEALLDVNRLHAVFLAGRKAEVLRFYTSLHQFIMSETN